MGSSAEDLDLENQKLKNEIELLKLEINSNIYKLLFESSPDIIIQVDKDDRIIIIHVPNQPIKNLNALKGKDIFSVTPLYAHDKMRKAFDQVFSKGEVVIYESEGETLGAYRYYNNYMSPIKDSSGNVSSIYFISREITQQKQSEKLISDSQRKLNALFESSQHIVSLLDRDGRLLWFNKKAFEKSIDLFGRHIEEGNKLEDYYKNEQFKISFRDYFNSALKGETIIFNREYEFINNETFSMEVWLQPVYEGNNLIGVSLIGIETADRKEYEEKLKNINKELIQQNEQLNQYSYIISHNLRGPIVTLMGLVNLFEQIRHDPVQLDEVMMHINKSAYHLDAIIKDLNAVLSNSDGKEAIKTLLYLDQEMETIRYLLRNQIESTHAIIECDFSACPTLFSIKSYIHNVLYNLLSNAIKYKKTNQVPLIKVSSYTIEGGYTCIQFRDEGIGFDLEKTKDKLFGFYKRFHNHVEGKGLGLHLIKKQIDILGGKIEVDSVVNEGTTFRVLLP